MQVLRGATTSQLLQVYPRAAYRYTSSYLFLGADWHQRNAMITDHYAFLNAMHNAAFFERVIGRGVRLWCLGTQHRRLAIQLLGPCLTSRSREGDLRLAFTLDDDILYSVAFSLIRPGRLGMSNANMAGWSDYVVYVGQVQGATGQLSRLREVSRLCRGIGPRELLMHAIAGAAAAWGVNRVIGVPGQCQLAAGYLSAARRFDYDAFWQGYTAERLQCGHFVIDLPLSHKPTAQVPAAHRSRSQRRRRFKQEVRNRVAERLSQECLLPPPIDVLSALSEPSPLAERRLECVSDA